MTLAKLERQRKIVEARAAEQRIGCRVGENEDLNGSVTNVDITNLLKAKGLRHRPSQDPLNSRAKNYLLARNLAGSACRLGQRLCGLGQRPPPETLSFDATLIESQTE
jgi:hypothetical protein